MTFCSKIGVRSFSLSRISSQSQLVKAPIEVYGVDGRYAAALYSAASKQKKLDAVQAELNTVKKLYDTDTKFRSFLKDPNIAKKFKQTTVVDTLKKLNQSEMVQNFFGTIAENGRMGKLEAIFKKFDLIMSAHRGEVQCEVTTAKTLDAAATKELNAALQAFVKSGQKMNIEYKVNEDILGGMIVAIGDRYVDMSIASKIRQYTSLIKEPV